MCVHKLSFAKYLISSTTVVCKFYYFVLSEILSCFSHCRCVLSSIFLDMFLLQLFLKTLPMLSTDAFLAPVTC